MVPVRNNFDFDRNMDAIEEAIENAGEEGGDFGDFMKGIEQNLMHMMKESAKVPETAMEHWQAFYAAVNWTETWIRALLTFHIVIFSIVVLARKSETAQTLLFFLVCGLIFLSEYLNSYCSIHWQEFATQNYFDNHGVFAATVYSGPLLIIALFQLVSTKTHASLASHLLTLNFSFFAGKLSRSVFFCTN